MLQSQKTWTINRLNSDGRVSRNEALKNYITRLGAIIWTLKYEGWQIEGKWERTPHSKDFVYYKRNRTFNSAGEANNYLKELSNANL